MSNTKQTEENIQTKYKNLFDINYQLREIATQCMTSLIPLTASRRKVVQLFLGKSYKTHNAILLLAKGGYGEDAVILARSLFEMLISLKYIFSRDDDYLAEKYLAYDAVLQDMMYEDTMSVESTRKLFLERQENPKPYDMSLETIKRDSLEAIKKYQFNKKEWSGKGVEGLSTLAGRWSDYKTMYNLQCQLSHPSTRGMNDYFLRDAKNPIMHVGPSENYVEAVLVMSHDYFYSILEICADYMKWDVKDKLQQSRDECSEELVRINS